MSELGDREARTFAEWAALPWQDRAAVLLRAAELLAGPWRDRLNAATMLGQGKTCHQAEIDAALVASSHGWTLERMPQVDRAILQVAVFEIAFAEDVPDAVAISEAVRLATDLSTDESPQFVNGVLAAVAASSRQSS